MSSALAVHALNARVGLRPTERLLLVLLADDANSDDLAFSSVSRLADRANINASTATAALSRLRQLGLVQRIHSAKNAAPGAWRLTLGTPAGDVGLEARA